jgi:hypothetical protein
MSYFLFGPNDLFYNQIKSHPKCDFLIYDGHTYYNNNPALTGNFGSNVLHMKSGHVSLYEINVDRPSGDLVYPFVVKDSSLHAFKTVTKSDFHSDYNYGDVINGTYPLTATISRERYSSGQSRRRLEALKNNLNYYKTLNPSYSYDFFDTEEINIINIPSIFYGAGIKKGSVDLKFYVTGTLIGRAVDKNKNGAIIEVTGSKAGNGGADVVGVVLYDEGFIILTASYDLDPTSPGHTEQYVPGASAENPAWVYFGAGLNSTGSIVSPTVIPSSSFGLSFEGTTHTPVITMQAHAPKGKLNFSNNPTYIRSGSTYSYSTSSVAYSENKRVEIKNIVSSSHIGHSASFAKQTYISKIGIYDKKENLIAIAKLATPVRKREEDNLTFRLKIDI